MRREALRLSERGATGADYAGIHCGESGGAIRAASEWTERDNRAPLVCVGTGETLAPATQADVLDHGTNSVQARTSAASRAYHDRPDGGRAGFLGRKPAVGGSHSGSARYPPRETLK